jgi:hypothetical protein
MEEGIRFDSHSDFSEAARSFREATVQSPEDADAWRMYGYELDNNELNFDSAATAFRKCLSIEPHDTDCVVGLLQSQNSLSQFDRSIEFFNSLPENLKQTPWVSEEFGYAQLGQKSYNEAMAAFERENRLGQSADEPSAINGSIEGRIQTRLLAGDNPTIVASYVEDEIQKFGGPPLQRANLELDLAAVDATSGREDDGIKHIRNALSISDQWHPELNISLMNTYHAEELLALCHAFDEATQVADSRHVNDDRDLAAAKFFIEGMRDLASPSSTQGAVRAFEQAYDTSPKPLYDFYRGKALLSIGHASEAKQAFQRFLDRRGDFQEDYIGLALLIPRAEKELATIDK